MNDIIWNVKDGATLLTWKIGYIGMGYRVRDLHSINSWNVRGIVVGGGVLLSQGRNLGGGKLSFF
jgi:hypothetical protein